MIQTKPMDYRDAAEIFKQADAEMSRPKLDKLKAAGWKYEDIITSLTIAGGELLPIRWRDWCVIEYAWAIPSAEAIDMLASQGTVIEIGAGSGYWAHRVIEAGGDVRCFDPLQWKTGETWLGQPIPQEWTPVVRIPHDEVAIAESATLFICWPDYEASWAAETLDAYPGDTFIYVGEGAGGCCGDDRFHDMLDADWEIRKVIYIPQFVGIRDLCIHYTRK